MQSLLFLLSFLPFFSLAGSFQEWSLASRRHSRRACPVHSRPTYSLTDIYQGKNFFDDWEFFTDSDPTNGNVNFLSAKDAFSNKLSYVQADGVAVMAVDDYSHVPEGGNRNSVRISTTKTYNGGLFIADIAAMPFGCSTWPAWWSVGPNWPAGGEIDVLEGVNNQNTDQSTLHTGDGCTLLNSPNQKRSNITSRSKSTFTGTVVGTQCASSGSNNDGCGILTNDQRSYGAGFNAAGGGVYAHLWDSAGIKIWFFSRHDIPGDITSKKPNPSSWPTPTGFWSSKTCDMASHFYDHVLTFDITLCGDLAGSAYPNSGCPGTCAQAVADPKNFHSAKWKINYVAVYNSTS